MKGVMIVGLACAVLMGANLAMAEEKAANPPAGAPSEADLLKTQSKELGKKITDIQKKLEASDEMVALKKKSTDAQKAHQDALKAKLAADTKYADAVKKVAETTAKLEAMGLKTSGAPKDSAKTLTDQEKTDVEAVLKERKEAMAQQKAIETELQATPEIKALQQAEVDTKAAYTAAVQAKLAADASAAPLLKEQADLMAKIRATEKPKVEKAEKPHAEKADKAKVEKAEKPHAEKADKAKEEKDEAPKEKTEGQ